jgi:hypothetical protein
MNCRYFRSNEISATPLIVENVPAIFILARVKIGSIWGTFGGRF